MLILPHHETSTLLRTLTHEESRSIAEALEAALIAFSTSPDRIKQPLRSSVTNGDDTTLFMPCSYSGTTCVKTVTVSPNHPPNGNITLLNSSGQLEAVVNAEEVTAYRTALASMLLLLKWKWDLKTAVVFGTGKQGEWAVRLLSKLFPGCRITMVGRKVTAAEAKIVEILRSDGVELGYMNWKDDGLKVKIEEATAVFCCTPATEVLFPEGWVSGKTYVSAIGSYKPHMIELDTELLKREGAMVVVDGMNACCIEAGELIQAGLEPKDLRELGDVLAAEECRDETTVFKCVGLAIMDLTVAKEVVRIAETRRVGTIVESFD